MREPRFLRLPQPLTIQIPGLITGGFLAGGGEAATAATPHDLPLRTLAVQDADLQYFEIGNGHPVVFVHGSFADYRAWFLQYGEFSRRTRMVLYSRRYHYPNTWSGDWRTCSIAQHAGDLERLLRALELGPATLVAQSSGGAVALELARRNPQSVHSLVLSEPYVMPLLLEAAPALWEAFERSTWVPARTAFDAGDVEGAVALLCDAIMGEGTYAGLPEDVRPIVLDNAPELRVEFHAPQFNSPFSMADAARIGAPVLLCQGDRSPPMFGAIADALAAALPNVTRRRFDNVCHVPPFFAPEAFIDGVFEFLGSLGVSAGPHQSPA